MDDISNNVGLRLNNPGNLRDPSSGNFRQFASPEEGHQALIDDIKTKQSGNSPHIKPGASLEQFANVWAPASDKNNPKNYAKTLAKFLGVDTAYAFDQVPPEKLASAIKVAEGTTALPDGSSGTSAPSQPHQLTHEQLTANIDAMEKQGASQEDIQGYLDSLKTSASPAPIVSSETSPTVPNITLDKGLGLDLGGGGVGPLDASGAVINAGKRVIGDVKQNVGEAAKALTASAEGKENPIEAGAQIFKNTTEAVVSPLTETVGKVIGAVANPVLKPIIDRITNSPTAQAFTDFMSKYPEVSDAISNVIQGGTNMLNLQGAEETPEAIAKTEISPSSLVENAKSAIKGSFEDNVDKALPVLKNDVRNLPQKYENVRTALGDIVDNKEELGLTDKKGNARLPDTFLETAQAQSTRMKDIYKEYTDKLVGVDKEKFDSDIQAKISGQIKTMTDELAKENSLLGQKALTSKIKELGSLRDTSPEGIQNYIESLNQEAKTAPGAPLKIRQIKAANLAGDLRKALDDSIEKVDGEGYQDLRNKYAAHRALRDQFLMAAKKEINRTPGLSEKITSLGVSAEGLNFLLTHNPQALLIAGGIKAGTFLTKWFNSPQRALGNLYQGLESGDYRPAPLSPEKIK